MKQIEAEYAEWRAASEETADRYRRRIAGEIGRQFKGLTVDEAAKLGAALLDLGSKANQGFTDIHDSALATANALADKLLPQLYKVKAALTGMPSIPSSVPGRAAGPVSAGRPYMVGEAGPEMFIPGQSGSITPNGGLPSAAEIGAAVVAALHRVPLVVPQNPVTDALYRNGPRAALKGYGRKRAAPRWTRGKARTPTRSCENCVAIARRRNLPGSGRSRVASRRPS